MPPGTAAAIDDRSLAELLHRNQPALRRFLRQLCGNHSDADDVLQDTLTKVWRLRHTYDASQNGDAWLRQAAFRSFCDRRRRERRQPQVTDAISSRPAAPTACRAELHDELQHRLRLLPLIERELLLGFHRDGLALHELAQRFQLPINTVKSHLHRARRRLQHR